MAAAATPSAPPLASCSSQTDFDDVDQDNTIPAFEWATSIVTLVVIVAIVCFVIASGLDDVSTSARASVFQQRLIIYRLLRGVNDVS